MKRLKSNFEHKDTRGVLIEVIRGNCWKQMNFYTIKKGFLRGGHYHKRTRELFFITDGKCLVKVFNVKTKKEKRFIAKEMDLFIVEPFEAHYLKALRDLKMITLLSILHNKTKPDIYETYK